MATVNYQQVQAAYNFFHQNIDSTISLVDVANTVGWKESTVRTYFSKKWDQLILTRVGQGVYHVCMPSEMTLSEFADIHTQVDEHLR
ncbi:hypothetical protein [uncultured Photobacterium sp.]|uniref:hypothetical protein n=1 Tax=uncultured Photobacterium sp. TaxID=173973 RepID=UPI0026345564|nr:hypothetical protein [uncultured Photobacterium sp.]